MTSVKQSFCLNGRVVIITGGAGLLGFKHAEAIAEMDGIPILIDINKDKLDIAVRELKKSFGVNKIVGSYVCDITNKSQLETVLKSILEEYGRIDGLINNAAIDPKVDTQGLNSSRLENYPLSSWNNEINVGLTGALLCSQVFGTYMAEKNKGVIVNIASDLGIIAPNQSLYHQEGVEDNQQSVKPVTYSVIKHGLIGLTRYLATYWAEKGVRCNALAPGGIFNDQNEIFIQKIKDLIPMKRMANSNEYKSAIVFLVSDASSYMTGTVLSIDGGRTCW
jgi:NAD(P)-dependent dehydrogenase (short-subunit alcohol dehydrogenase family)